LAWVAFVLAIVTTTHAVEPFRDFRNKQGQVTNARLIGVKGDQVAIQTRAGKTFVHWLIKSTSAKPPLAGI